MNSHPWEFAVLSGTDGLATLTDEWEALASRLPRLHIAQCPQWSGAYLSCLAPRPESLVWITARRDGLLEAVFPLEKITKGWGPLGVRELRTLIHDHITLADIVADPAETSLWPALHAWMQHEAPMAWDRLMVPHLAEDAVLARWLSTEAAPASRQARVVDGSAWLDCDRTYEALLKATSSNHRSNMSRAVKRTVEMGGLRYETFSEPESLAIAMTTFLAIEASGWKGAQGGAVACKPELIEFYNQLARDLGAHGRCEIDLLWLGDRAIATVFWFRTGGTLHLQKIAYDEELSNLGPGRLIMAEALKRACADPTLQRLSFITRCPWADGWRTTITPVWRYVLYPATMRGRFTAWADRNGAALKTWFKARLRRPVPDEAPAPA